jgi:hypothetical protein
MKWGNKKSSFYADDVSKIKNKDAIRRAGRNGSVKHVILNIFSAEQEEAEAKMLQKKKMQLLSQEDFEDVDPTQKKKKQSGKRVINKIVLKTSIA